MAVIALMLAALADWRTPGGFIDAPGVGAPPLPDPAMLWPRLANLSDSPVHILLLGVDRRRNEQCRSDAIAVLRCESDTLTLISLSRDSVVFLNGSSTPQKINAAYAFGGTALAKREIGKLLGVTFDGCVVVDFVTFVKVAQTVKTLTWEGRLIGAEALLRDIDGLLTWLRSRSSAGGDDDRMKKHQLFMVRGFAYMLKLWNEHPDVYEMLLSSTLAMLEADITPPQVLALTVKYRAARQEQIERYIMPGTPVWIDFNSGREASYEEAMAALHGGATPADTAAAQAAAAAAAEAAEQLEQRRYQAEAVATGDGFVVLGEGEAAAAAPGDTAARPEAPPPLILSYFRLEPGMTVARLVARHRGRGEASNYTYDRDLDIAVRRGLDPAPLIPR